MDTRMNQTARCWILAVVIAVASFPAVPCHGQTDEPLACELERLTNDTRSEHGLSWLEPDQELERIANLHGRDMLSRDYIDHYSPEGKNATIRVAEGHRRLFGVVGENIAAYDSRPMAFEELGGRIMNGWMNSPGHRDNILASGYNVIGVGCWREGDGRYQKRRCTQLFAHAWAYSLRPVPEKAAVGTLLNLRFRLLGKGAFPTAMAQVSMDGGRILSFARLSRIGDDVFGRLTIQGPPGPCRLELHVPDPGVPLRYNIIPGPVIGVLGGR